MGDKEARAKASCRLGRLVLFVGPAGEQRCQVIQCEGSAVVPKDERRIRHCESHINERRTVPRPRIVGILQEFKRPTLAGSASRTAGLIALGPYPSCIVLPEPLVTCSVIVVQSGFAHGIATLPTARSAVHRATARAKPEPGPL